MTSLVAWVGADSRGPSSLNLASDSRISWGASTWDLGRKLFASRTTPDVLGFVGQVTFPTTALGQILDTLDAGLLSPNSDDASIRCEALRSALETSFRALPRDRQEPALILYGARDGHYMDSTFRLWTIELSAGPTNVSAVHVPERSSILRIEGSGTKPIETWLTRWESSSQGGTSRAVFSAFCDALADGRDAKSGGAPQLVGLYRKGPAKTFGTVYAGRTWYNGIAVSAETNSAFSEVEWRNSLFERCDSSGQRLHSAQHHHSPKGLGADQRGRG